jgi:hypothetical protein
VNEETYACAAKACGQEDLCVGCVWQCADCLADFCEGHIVDLNDIDSRVRYSVYVCRACLERRGKKAVAA